MYGYEVILESPRRDKQIGLRFISNKRYSSVVSLLCDEGLDAEYRDWNMLSFRCAYASTPTSSAVEVECQLPKPGTLVTAVV